MKQVRRTISLLLAMVMALLAPLGAFAEDGWSTVDSNTVSGAGSTARVEFLAQDQLLSTQIYEQGQSIEALPQASMKEGCEFSGWYCGGTPVVTGTVVTGNMTVVAEYTPVSGHRVIVNYAKNGDVFNHVVRSYTPTDAPDTILSPDSIDNGNRGRLYPDQASIRVNPAELTEEETVYTVNYVAADSKYKIRHMGKNIAGTGYDVLSETEYDGVDGSVITPATGVYEGFEFERFESAVVERGKVNSATVYYTRKICYLDYNTQGGSYVDQKSTVYGGSVTVAGDTPTREGYTFAGWYKNAACTTSAGTSLTLKDNAVVYAKWTPAKANFRVNYYIEDIQAGAAPIFLSSETRSGTVGSDTGVTSSNLKPSWGSNSSAGFETPSAGNITNAIVAADGSTSVSVVYPRKTFTVTFKKNNQTVGSISAKYEAFIGDQWSVINNKYAAGSPWKWSLTGYDTTYQDSMPAANTTATWTQYSGTARTLSYYVEDPNGSYGDPRGQGKKFRLLNAYTIKISNNASYTYNDEYRAISGYSRYYSTLSGWNSGTGNQTVGTSTTQNFYYSLNQYPLTMYNNNAVFFSGNVAYTYPISSYLSKVPAAPVEGATFAGWYTDAALQYRNTATTMPKGLQLYAKWNMPTRKVTFDLNYEGGGATETEVTYNTAATSYTPVRDGYTFAGWYTTAALTGKYDFAKPVTANITVYAKWVRSNLAYTVHYYLTGTTTSVYPDKTAANQDFILGQEVTENAVTVKSEGVSFRADAPSRTITLGGDNSRNVITFYYSKCEATTYTVHYVKADENGGTTQLMPSVTKTASVETERVVEVAPQANGLLVDESMKSLVLSSDAARNTITFVYSEPGKQPVTVRYVDTAGNALFAEDSARILTGNDYTAVAKAKTGYVPDRQQATIHVKQGQAADNTITFVYSKRSDLSYTVKCYLVGTTTPAGNEITVGNQTFEDTVTVTAPALTGYTLQSAGSVDLTIGIEGNTAVFYYYKNVTVTAEDKRSAFGDPEETLTAAVEGTLNGENVTYSLERAQGQAVGEYTVTASGDGIQGYYKVSYMSGTYTVTKQTMTLDAPGYTGEYDGQAHGNAAVPSVTNGTAVTYSVNGGAWTSTVPKITDVGTVNVSVRAENPNYETATADYSLTVNRRTVTVRANNGTKVYGSGDPTLTAVVEGNLNGDNVSYTVTRAAGENVGDYVITVTGDAAQGNYAVACEPGTFTITPSGALSISGATDYNGVYDGQAHGSAVTANVTEGTTVSYRVDGGQWTTTAPTITDVGSKTVEVKAENANYQTVTGSYTLTVTPKPVTVTAVDGTKVYGEDDPALTATVNGTLGEDTVNYTVTRAAGENVGDYAITVTGDQAQGNYSVTCEPGTFTITPSGALSISGATNYNGVYDGQAHGSAVTANVTEGTTVSYRVDGGQWIPTVPTITDVGSKTVEVKAENPNYNTATGSYILTVTPKPVTVTAVDGAKVYGSDDPTLTATVDGTLGEDAVNYTVTRAAGENVGDYAITVTGDQAQGNYSVTCAPGTFTITPSGALSISGATNYNGVYDAQAHGSAVTANVTEGTTVSYRVDGGQWTTTMPTITDVGSKTVEVKAENSNYQTVTGSYTLTVTPRPVTVTAVDGTKVYGSDDPTLTATVDGTLGEDTVNYTVTRAAGETVGDYAITVTGDQAQGNYSVTCAPGTFSITASDALTVSTAGYNASYDGQSHGGTVTASITEGTTVSYRVNGGQWTTTAPTITDAGTVTVNVKAENANYVTATGSYTLNVTRAAASVTAVNNTKVYGTGDPNLTATVSGTVGRDTLRYTVTRAEGENVGNYPITASGDRIQGNYTVTYTGANFTVTRNGSMDIRGATDYNGVYDGQSHGPTVTANVTGGTTVSYRVDGGQWTTTVPTITDVGSKRVEVKAENPNYETVTGSYTLTVTPKPVTVTAVNGTKVYGSDDPILTATVNGTLNGDNVSYTVTRAAGENVGDYVITVTGDQTQGNYSVTCAPGTFTITRSGALSISGAVNYNGVYDGQSHGSTVTANVTEGTTVSYRVNGGQWTTTAPDITDVGNKRVEVKAENPNYQTATGNYTLTVTPKPVTVTAVDGTKVYGSDDPTLTATVEGLLGEDSVNYRVTRERGENAGDYTITVTGNATQGNYAVACVPGTFTITPANTLTVGGTAYDAAYDGNPHGSAAIANVPAGTTVSYQVNGGEWTGTVPTLTDVGTLNVNVKAENPNYVTAENSYTLNVTRRAVTVTAENKTKMYGSDDPDLTAAVSGTVNGDSIAYDLTRATGENVGTYAITASGDAVQGNYTVSYTGAAFTVTANDTLTVTGTGYSAAYDGNAHGGAAMTNVPDGTTVTYQVDGGEWTATVPTITNVGSVTVKVRAENSNYTTAESTYTLTVTPARVTVTADNKTKVYGENDPTLTATVTGLIGRDTVNYTVTRAEGENVGNYPITASGDRIQGNYEVSYTGTNFSITRSGDLAIGGAVSYNDIYDGQTHGEAVTVTVTEGTTVSYRVDGGEWSTTAPTITDVGSVRVEVKAENPNYETAYDSYTLTVRAKPVTVTAVNGTKVYGGDDPTLTAVVNGTLGEDSVSYTVTRAEGENVGHYPITVSGNANQGNYAVEYAGADFSITRSGALEITGAANYNDIYDAQTHETTVTPNVSGGTTVSYRVNGGEWTTTPPDITDVGSVTVEVKAENPNYETVYDSYTLTVRSKPVTVTAVNGTKVYGSDDPTLTAEVSGLLGEDSVSYTVTRAEGENVGNYPITAAGAQVQGNYTVSYTGANFSITPSGALTIGGAVSYNGTYDGQSHGSTVTPSVTGGTTVYYRVDGGEWTTTVPNITDVGSVTVEVKAENPNYETATGSYTLTVTPRAVTVTAVNGTKVYGTDDPALTAVVNGTLSGDSVNYTVTRAAGENTGDYAITVTGAETQGNYVVSCAPGVFTVTPANTLTVTGTGYNAAYDGATHGAAAITNVPSGTTVSYRVNGGEWTPTAPTIRDVGSVTVSVKAENTNYVTAESSYTLAVTPRNAVVTARNNGKMYGAAEPTLTAEVSGLVEGESVSYTVTRAEGENVGDYPITAAGAQTQGNYSVSYVPAVFTVTANDTLTVTGTSYNAAYDGNTHGGPAMTNVPTGTTVTYQADGGEWTDTPPTITDAGSVTVKVRAENPNYEPVESTYTLTVTPAQVTVTANNNTKVYGQDDPTLTANVSGTVGNDTVNYTVTRAAGENVNTYAITAAGDRDQGNYTVTYAPGTFTITRSNAMTVNGTSYGADYDGNTHGGAAITNVPAGTTVTYQVDGGEWTTTPPTVKNVDSVTVKVRAENPNYEPVESTYTLVVNPARVTVTAIGNTKVYGQSDPTLTANVTGLIGRDNVNYTVTRTAGEDVGDYPITAAGAETQGNYTVSYGGAVFTITRNTGMTIDGATSYDGTYDGQPHGSVVTPNVTDGTTVYYKVDGGEWTTTPPTLTDVGSVTVSVKAENPNYETVTGSYTLTVTPAPVTVKAVGNTKVYGGQDPQLTAEVTGTLNGDTVSYTVTRTPGEDVGHYPITVSGTRTQGNYEVTCESADFEITRSVDLTLDGATDYTGDYDGQPHGNVVTPTVTDGTTVYYRVDGGEWTTTPPVITDAGSVTVEVKAENPNYETATGTYTLTVDKRKVKLTSATDEKVYDGTALTNDTVTAEGFVNGEGADITVTGTQTYVGQSDNTFTYSLKEGTRAENYTITEVVGTLTVKDEGVDHGKVIAKTHEAGTYDLGDEVVFTLTVTNIYDTPRNITLREMEGMRFTTANVFGGVAPGATVQATATHTVTEADLEAGILTNTATVSFSGGGTYGATDTVTPEAVRPEVTLKTETTSAPADGSAYTVGEDITYRVTVTNDGNVTLENLVVTDALTGQTYTVVTLAPGETVTFDETYTVAAADGTLGEVTAQAAVTGSYNGPNGTVTLDRTVEEKVAVHPDVTLTIRYRFEEADAGVAAPDVVMTLPYGSAYRIVSPVLTGYLVSDEAVEGILIADTARDVVYTLNEFTLTIDYVYADGSEAAESYTATVTANDSYSVASPVIGNYACSEPTVSGIMPAHDVIVTAIYVSTVTYVKIENEAVPLATQNSGNTLGDTIN